MPRSFARRCEGWPRIPWASREALGDIGVCGVGWRDRQSQRPVRALRAAAARAAPARPRHRSEARVPFGDPLHQRRRQRLASRRAADPLFPSRHRPTGRRRAPGSRFSAITASARSTINSPMVSTDVPWRVRSKIFSFSSSSNRAMLLDRFGCRTRRARRQPWRSCRASRRRPPVENFGCPFPCPPMASDRRAERPPAAAGIR